MDTSKPDNTVVTSSESGRNTSRSADHGLNDDAARLAQMGYTQDMRRNFSIISLIGIAFSLSNSWFGISVRSNPVWDIQ
jgi:hypothetical protein